MITKEGGEKFGLGTVIQYKATMLVLVITFPKIKSFVYKSPCGSVLVSAELELIFSMGLLCCHILDLGEQ